MTSGTEIDTAAHVRRLLDSISAPWARPPSILSTHDCRIPAGLSKQIELRVTATEFHHLPKCVFYGPEKLCAVALTERRDLAFSMLVASVQMYGGMGAFLAGENDNPYYLIAQQKPSPLEEEFDADYFKRLISGRGIEKLSAKGFLATEQRIPGLGNGVLQDILYRARIPDCRGQSASSGC